MQLQRSGQAFSSKAAFLFFAAHALVAISFAAGFSVVADARIGVADKTSKILPPSELRVDFALHGSDWNSGSCGSRKYQSPVNLNDMSRPADDYFTYDYKRGTAWSVAMTNDGRLLTANFADAKLGGLALPANSGGAAWYPLQRLDFHASSEHTLNGKHAPLEVQLVHRAPTGSTAGHEIVIVSVLVECDHLPTPPDPPAALTPEEQAEDELEPGVLSSLLQEQQQRHQRRLRGGVAKASVPAGYEIPSEFDAGFNAALQPFVAQEPPVADDVVLVTHPDGTDSLGLGNLLENGTFFMYRGSETLPPCEENVVWLVRRERVRASDAQVRALFSRLYSTSNDAGNYRTIMPMNQRDVLVLFARHNTSIAQPSVISAPTAAPVDGAYALALANKALENATVAANEGHRLEERVLRANNAGSTRKAVIANRMAVEKEREAKAMKFNIRDEVMKQVVPATKDLTYAYVKQELLGQVGGFPKPP